MISGNFSSNFGWIIFRVFWSFFFSFFDWKRCTVCLKEMDSCPVNSYRETWTKRCDDSKTNTRMLHGRIVESIYFQGDLHEKIYYYSNFGITKKMRESRFYTRIKDFCTKVWTNFKFDNNLTWKYCEKSNL